jgi:type IV secretory pathway component VirB8
LRTYRTERRNNMTTWIVLGVLIAIALAAVLMLNA